MKTIYKYPLFGSGVFSLIDEIPENAVPLYVGVSKGQICVWFQVDTDNKLEQRKILIRGTGQAFTGEEGAYIGTIITPSNRVWHYFDDATKWEDPSWVFTTSEAVDLDAWMKDILTGPLPVKHSMEGRNGN